MQPILHPTKEQVRAYMHLREFDRRPPPMPDEIRRQLGWHSASDADSDSDADRAGAVYRTVCGYAGCNSSFSFSPVPAGSSLLFPGTIAQLATLLAVEWCFLAAGISRSR